MAEGFEPFHVPQQSRRDKLRVVLDNNSNCQEQETLDGYGGGLLPSLIPPHMLGNSFRRNPVYYVKQEGRNPHMSYYVGGFMNTISTTSASASASSSSSSSSSPSSSHQRHHYSLDPQSSLPVNVNYSSIQDVNNNNTTNNNINHFLYTPHQSIREPDPSSSYNRHGGGEVVPTTSTSMYKPQALSLSLSSHHQQLNVPRSLGSGGAGAGAGASISNDIRSAVPLGPFTGYASILKGSRFLVPAQQLLEDLCHVGQGYVQRSCVDSTLMMDPSMDNLNEIVDDFLACSDNGEHRKKKTRLITLLDEVYRRYKLYYQQMQTIVSSFESVAGLANAAPYTSFALKAMSKHFRCMKNAITDQLRISNKSQSEGNHKKDESLRFNTADMWDHGQRTSGHNPVILGHQPVWRPQRGLPEKAVSVLRAWLFEHFLHPYPTDTDKQTLAKQTGLSRSQVSNWFINARVRVWKPMVEEIHMLETCQQSQTTSDREDQNFREQNEALPSQSPCYFNNQPQIKSAFKGQDHTSKRSRSDLHSHIPDKTSELMNLTYNDFSNHHNVGSGVGTSGGNSGVSLTLGLQQNNGIGLSEALPMNIARRFGLEASNEGYIGSFEAPNKHFGGRLLHDFVG